MVYSMVASWSSAPAPRIKNALLEDYSNCSGFPVLRNTHTVYIYMAIPGKHWSYTWQIRRHHDQLSNQNCSGSTFNSLGILVQHWPFGSVKNRWHAPLDQATTGIWAFHHHLHQWNHGGTTSAGWGTSQGFPRITCAWPSPSWLLAGLFCHFNVSYHCPNSDLHCMCVS